MKTPIKPVNGNVLLLVEELKKVSKIHNPNAKIKTQFRVIACHHNQEFKEGDLVIFDKEKGVGRELNGGKYILINPEYICGVVEEK